MAENNEQQVGYRSSESADRGGQSQAGSNAFPSEQQQKQAAATNKVQYSDTDTSDIDNGPGTGPTMPGPGGTTASTATNPNANAAAAPDQDNATPLRDNNASSPGLAPNRAESYPGPGTASDRGTGSVGATPFGTGAGDNGLESTSGLDERDTIGTNTASYDLSNDVGNPLSDAGVTGSGTPGRDDQFNEMGTGEGDFSSRATDTGSSPQ